MCKLTKGHIVKMTVNEKANRQIAKLMKWKIDKIASKQNYKLANGKLIKSQVDNMSWHKFLAEKNFFFILLENISLVQMFWKKSKIDRCSQRFLKNLIIIFADHIDK